jgi:TonB family protein
MMPAITTANLLVYSLQVAAISVLGGGAVTLLKLASPRARLICFRALVVACLALPFVQPAPKAAAPMAPKPAAAALGVTVEGAGPTGARMPPVSVTPEPGSRLARAFPRESLAKALWVVIVAGIAARLAWLLIGLVALKRLRDKSTPFANDGWPILNAQALVGEPAEFLASDAVQHPVTFGAIRRVVLLPASYAALDETEQTAIACHELLHVRRRDWLFTVGEELVRALLWFHPAVWWLVGQIDLSREQLVDQQVVALTQQRRSYVNALVRLAVSPAGPVLRPASLFLGRAHLLERVALLSREVRMSRFRFVASLVLIVVALFVGGRLIVEAFPLAPMPQAVSAAVPMAAPLPAATPQPSPSPPSRPLSTTLAESVQPTAAPMPAAQDLQPAQQPTGIIRYVDTAWVSPIRSASGEAIDNIVVMQAAVGMYGAVSDVTVISGNQAAAEFAVDAVRGWQWTPPKSPFTTVVGVNLARQGQYDNAVPVRVGGEVKAPQKVKDVRPVYPQDAQEKGIQGIVIAELLIDGAGTVVAGNIVRPIAGLDAAALTAVLQWKFAPDPDVARKMMTVTCNFTLVGGNVAAGAPPPPPPPPASRVGGGVAGGVSGGVEGGIVGGIMDAAGSSFGPPSSLWPPAVRVGGNIAAPRKLVDVRPVYPKIAESARVQGMVIVEAFIGEDGKVWAGRILRSIPLLDQAALEAVAQWQFTPTLNGVAVPVIMTVTVSFTLQ